MTALSIMRLVDRPGRVEPGSKILFEGRDLAKLSENEMSAIRGNEISMIFQERMTSLNPVFTVGNQIAEAVVLVLRNSGPRGGPGMPEWGQIPIPSKLLSAGVTDMVRVSDARTSGTAFGTVVLHVAPAPRGPLRAPDGDTVELDVDAGRIDVDVPGDEIAARLERLGPAEPRYRRGYGAMFLDHVLQADEGCDFDFLRARPDDPEETEPYGLLSGWVGGW